MSDRYESLRLRNQLCFPVYLCAKEIVNRYAKPLGELDLSYTQYVIMMFLWENGETTAKRISDALLLDQSTLTPLLRK
ncbi:MAG: MarR family transcriptional regulator, partial [Clostridia bacterium]|nr:MarR family transcriptional regulator [Clostridia bacterium]